MELQSCDNTHFIKAIRGGVVVKVCNIFHGRPALVRKTLLDIYESEDAKKLGRLPKMNSHNKKCGNLHALVVDRALHDGLDTELDDSITLKQLIERSQMKKRKLNHRDENTNKVYSDVKREIDDSDLNEPLVHWKLKKLKNSNPKRKHMAGSVASSSLTDVANTYEHNLVSESFLEVGAELSPLSCVKTEEHEWQSKNSFAYDSSHGFNEEPNHADVVSNEHQKMVQLEFRAPLFSAEEHQNIVPNEILYDHLEDIEPLSILVPFGEARTKSNPPEMDCHEFLDLAPLALEMGKQITEDHNISSPSDIQDSVLFSHSTSSSSMEGISQQSSQSGLHVPLNSIDSTEEDLADERDDSLSFPDKNCSPTQNSIDSLKMDSLICPEDTTVAGQTLSCTFVDINIKCSKDGKYTHAELMNLEEKQTKSHPKVDIENQSRQMDKTFNSADTLSSSEPYQPPGGHRQRWNSYSGLQVLDKSIGGTNENLEHKRDDSPSLPDIDCSSSQKSIDSLKADCLIFPEDTKVDGEQTLSCTLDDINIKCSKGCKYTPDELMNLEEKQTNSHQKVDIENQSCQMDKTSDSADTLPSPEPYQPPGRHCQRWNSYSGLQVLNRSIGGTKENLEHKQDDSPSNPDKGCGSPQKSIDSLKMDNLIYPIDTIVDEEQTLSCTFDINQKGAEGGKYMNDELLRLEEKQTNSSPSIDAVNQSCKLDKTSDRANTLSSPEPYHSPGRILLKRKIISPSSQEQLCLAMNSVEICNDVDQYQCQDKSSGGDNGKKAFRVRSDTAHAKKNASPGGPGKFSQKKIAITPRQINKTRSDKGNLEGPRFARTLPNFNTGCTSVQDCSENAVAFSERQMHDMETLAVKLINELNSMKDFVEQKMLFESYRSVSLKNDADEVKSAIKNATKVEETAQKWLKMMSRDCSRFCKIMELTPEKVDDSSKDAVLRERKKKIRFADEAGGDLCNFKFFEASSSSSTFEAGKQESRSI